MVVVVVEGHIFGNFLMEVGGSVVVVLWMVWW